MDQIRFRGVIESAVEAALDAVRPGPLVRAAIVWEPDALVIGGTRIERRGLARVHVVAAGKASRGMALGARRALGDVLRVTGTVATVADRRGPLPGLRHPPDSPLAPFDVRAVRRAGSNRPTAEAEIATRQVLADVAGLGPDDALLVLLSGGGSALLAAPRPPVTLAEKVLTIDRLDAAGASIDLLNAVRRRISDVKGGRLAVAARHARATVGLLLSDVEGDDPAVIASGPLVGGPDADVVERVRALGVLDELPSSVQAALHEPLPVAAAPCHVIASPDTALAAMVTSVSARGMPVVDLGRVSGPVDDVVDVHVRASRDALTKSDPACIVSAGESTVVLPPAHGVGSRATHLAVALGVALQSDSVLRGIWSLGVSPTDAEDAGFGDTHTRLDARAFQSLIDAGEVDARRALADCDTARVVAPHSFMRDRPAEWRSNVQDLRVVVVGSLPDDRARWNRRHAAPGHRRDGRPTAWLAEVTQHLPTAGRALDVACGDGGDVVHLAVHGLHVTGVDVSPVALDKARALAERRGVADRVHLVEHDLAQSSPPLEGEFDVIAVTHFHDPLLVDALRKRLAPNGWLAIEVATRENLVRGLPSPPERYLAEPGELLRLATGLTVRRYREMEIDGMVRAQLLAQNTRSWDYPRRDEEDDATGTDGDEG